MAWINSILGAVFMIALCGTLFAVLKKLRMPAMENIVLYRCPSILVIILATTAVWIGILYKAKQFSFELLLDMIFLIFLSVLAWIDWKSRIIPNLLLLLMLLTWCVVICCYMVANINEGVVAFLRGIAGALLSGMTFLLCYLLSHKQLGGGDVKLSFVMGFYLTIDQVMAAIFYGVLLSCVFSILQLIRKRLKMQDGIPLVPFLYCGCLIAYLIK